MCDTRLGLWILLGDEVLGTHDTKKIVGGVGSYSLELSAPLAHAYSAGAAVLMVSVDPTSQGVEKMVRLLAS